MYLQLGQGGVVVEEAGWNICDQVEAEAPKRK
jgi:hypothetical protein